MDLAFEPIRIASDDSDRAMLAFRGNAVVAVLSQLSDVHTDLAGQWYVECSFGADLTERTFAALDAFSAAYARRWRLKACLKADAFFWRVSQIGGSPMPNGRRKGAHGRDRCGSRRLGFVLRRR